MKELFLNILESSLSGSVVILVVLILRLVLKKAPRTVFCLLWLLAGLRLVLPFEIESSLSLQPRFEPVQQTQTETLPAYTPTPTVPQVFIDAEGVNENGGNVENTVTIQEEAASSVEIRVIDYGAIAVCVWIVGLAVLCISSLVSYWKLKWQIRQALLLENGCWESANIETAFVLGFLPPKIYLPAGLSEEDRNFIFAHENTHIARHDHWYKLMGYVVLAVHWFNPLVWVAYNLLCKDIELACDEHVVKYMTVAERKAYSAALLSCSSQHRTIAACPVAFGEISVKQRILSVLHYRKPGFWVSLVAVIAVIFVAVCFMTSPGQEEPDLSFLNYKNAVSLVAEQENVFVMHQYASEEDTSTLSICKADGRELAQYLDNVSWLQWFESESHPGFTAYIDLEVHDDYNIRVYDSGYADVMFQDDIRRYRISKSDYEELAGMISSATPEHFEEADSLMADESADELLVKCQRALEDLQSQMQFHLTGSDAFYANGTLNNSTTVEFWQDEANWLRITGTEDTALYKDGTLYSRTGSSEPSWEVIDAVDAAPYRPWLCSIAWDAQIISFVDAETVDGEHRITVTIHSSPPGVYWGLTEYDVCFVFDDDGALRGAVMTCSETDNTGNEVSMAASLYIEAEESAVIRDIIEMTYTQIPSGVVLAGMPTTEAGLLDKCRIALEAFQAQETYALMIERQFGGPGALNDNSTQIYYGNGDDWLRQSLVSGVEPSGEDWYLVKDGEKYSRYIYTFDNPAHGENSDTGWVEGFQDGEGQVSEPWLRTFDWNAEVITFAERKIEGDSELITFFVQGSPFDSNITEVSQYQVTFQLRANGELWRVFKSYTQTWPAWSNGEQTIESIHTSVAMSLDVMAPEEIMSFIDIKHLEAKRSMSKVSGQQMRSDWENDRLGEQ